ncbi:MAG: thymidylate kinase, partial [Nitrosopumilaceae archaeon]
IYRDIAKNECWKIIDASKPKQEIHKDILKVFTKKIGL